MAKRTYTDVPEPRYVERALNIVDKSIPYSGTITQEIIDALKDQRSTGITYQGKTFRYSLTSGNNDIYSYVGSESGKVYFEKITINTANKTWSYARQEITAVVQGVDVKSTGIAANRVLAADGEGGSQWNIALTLPEPPQETKSIAVNSDGEIVYVDAPVFSVNGRTGVVTGLAEQDGYYTSLTAGTAEQILSTVSVNDKVPYLFRTSGGNADIGNRELDKLVGGTICWNQIIPIPTTSTSKTENGVTFVDNRNGTYTFSTESTGATADVTMKVTGKGEAPRANHIAMLTGCPVGGGTDTYYLRDAWTTSTDFGNGKVYKMYETGSWDVRITVKSGAVITTPITFTPCLIDLTQMFGSTIADYIYSLEQSNAGDGVAFVRPFIENADKSYNAGELVSVKTSAHEMTGFNLFDSHSDIESTFSSYANQLSNAAMLRVLNTLRQIQKLHQPVYYTIYATESTSGAGIVATGTIRCYAGTTLVLQLTPNIINTAILTADLSNVTSISIYGTSPAKSITFSNAIINLSHSGYRNGEYEPYVKHTYALDSDLELRGIPKLDASNKLYYDGDEYASDGTVTRKYGIVDLGTLTWTKTALTETESYFAATISGIKKASATNVKANIVCSKFVTTTADAMYLRQRDKAIAVLSASPTIWVYDTAYNDSTTTEFKTAMSGVYLVYELETPTTETADPYTNPQIVDDFGTERYVDERDVPVPVGHDTDYLANLRDKLQRLPNIPAEDGDYIVRCANGQCSFIGYVEKGRMELDITSIGTVTSTSLISGMWYRTNIGVGSVSISDTDTLFVKMSNGAVYPCINNYASSQLVIFGASDLSAQTVVKLWKII